jgi:hypothetical protein
MGTVPQWVSAVATVLAICWAVFLYQRSLKDKRIEKARLVYALPGQAWVIPPGDPLSLSMAADSVSFPRTEGRPVDDEVEVYESDKRFGCVSVTLHNDSDEVISRVWVELQNDYLRTYSHAVSKVVPFVAPHSIHTFEIWFPYEEKAQLASAVFPICRFTDCTGRRWDHSVIDRVRPGDTLRLPKGERALIWVTRPVPPLNRRAWNRVAQRVERSRSLR